MKKNIILIISFLAVAVFVNSCGRKAEFETESFATFEADSYAVSETVGTFTVPVTIYNPIDKEVQIIVKAYGDSAEEGTDFSIVYPVSGVLTFAPGESTKEIEIEVEHDTEMTGSKYFDLVISSADDSFTVGQINTVNCKIKDNEHPLSEFIGDWEGNAIDLYTETETTLSVSILEDEYDETYKKLRIRGLDPESLTMSKTYTLRAEVNSQHTKISIANEQPVGYDDDYASYFVFYAFKIVDGQIFIGDGITLDYDKNAETLTIRSAFGTLYTMGDGYQYIGSVYVPASAEGIVLRPKK